MGAIAYSDKISYPWFAPAGFNRAALDFVNNVSVRLNQPDRVLPALLMRCLSFR
jgi:hypothetical protein